MPEGLNIVFFGSSLTSSYWNGAATYYRGLLRALAQRGHRITFMEPDAFDRQKHRDIPDPPYARVIVYQPTPEAVESALSLASGADIVVKASGVGVMDSLLEHGVVDLRSRSTRVIYWDVDAPATLERLNASTNDPLRDLLPRFDMVLTYGGGDPVVEGFMRLGARRCEPVYNALDPQEHYPVLPERPLQSDLMFLGNRLPDRDDRVEEFLFKPARLLPRRRFLLGGSGWEAQPMPANIECLGHVSTRVHNSLYASALVSLNISRRSMAAMGYSPATRVFEAAGCAACLMTDSWKGIEQFLTPKKEVLVASSGEQVAELLDSLTLEQARRIGQAARRRVLAEHTYSHRALQVERLLDAVRPRFERAGS